MFRCLTIRRAFSSQVDKTPGGRYVKPVTGIRKFVGEKLYKIVDSYERFLGTRFPRVFKVYKGFSLGTRGLAKDYVEYLRISGRLLTGTRVRDLTYHELMLYFHAPKDMIKVGPLVLVAVLPFTGYVILPLIVLFPQILSHQFWNIQQKADFEVNALTKRLFHARPVFRHLQAKLEESDLQKQNPQMAAKCQSTLYKLGSGIHPSPEEILNLKHLFEGEPYGLKCLKRRHLFHLCKLNNVRTFLPLRRRLFTRTGFIRELDLAIIRQGGPETLNQDDLRRACFMRGLNPFGCRKEETIKWLTQWIMISKELNSNSLSLLAHCPILLAYNEPSNWKLIYPQKLRT